MQKFCKALLCLLSIAFAARADFIDLWANKLDMPVNKAPHTGRSKLLVIPVQIDYAANPPIDMVELTAFFTAAPQDGALNFRGFYQRASLGRFQPEVTVAPLVRYNGCPAMLAGGPGCNIGRGDIGALKAGMDFVRDAFRRTHDEGKVDFSQFDVNGLGGQPDGVVDGVMLVVNEPAGIGFPIEYVNNGSNLNGGTGGALILDGVKIPYVAVGGTSMVLGKPRFDLVVLHEFGHVLGLADLYYEHPPIGTDPFPKWQGLHFSLMGDYSYDDRATLPDAESRRALGWQDLRVIGGTQTLTLQPAAAGGYAVKLGQMNDQRKEYFLVEARGPVGAFDKTVDGAGQPVWGLSVTHVDWSRGPKPEQGAWIERLISCLDCDPYHPFLRNLESSNLFGLVYAGPGHQAGDGTRQGESDERVLYTQGDLVPLANAGVLSAQNRYTATNWYDGSDSGIRIENVSVNADHSVTATFTAPAVANACSDVVCGPNEDCVRTGALAGNCQALVATIPDGGVAGGTDAPPDAPPQVKSGCSTTGGVTSGLAALAFLALLRRRRSFDNFR